MKNELFEENIEDLLILNYDKEFEALEEVLEQLKWENLDKRIPYECFYM